MGDFIILTNQNSGEEKLFKVGDSIRFLKHGLNRYVTGIILSIEKI